MSMIQIPVALRGTAPAPFVAEDGGGLVPGGIRSYTQLLSRGTDPFIKIVNKDGREQTITP